MKITSKKTSVTLSLMGIILLVGFDQLCKYLAVLHLQDAEDVTLIKGVLTLHYLENFGAAFGSFQGATIGFLILTVVFLGVLGYIVWKIPMERKYLALRLVTMVFAAGAIGNFVDRLAHRYVIDFIYFCLIDFPVFNVADIYVTCSCIVFIFLFLFYYKDQDFDFLKKQREDKVK